MPKVNAVLMTVLAVALIALVGILALRPAAAPDREPERLARLVRKLGDPDPDVRREGESGLRKAGSAATASLREASHSADRVLAERAAKLLQELQPAQAPSPVSSPLTE